VRCGVVECCSARASAQAPLHVRVAGEDLPVQRGRSPPHKSCVNTLDRRDPRLAEFMRGATTAYAATRLGGAARDRDPVESVPMDVQRLGPSLVEVRRPNRKYPRTPCIIVLVDDAMRPASPRPADVQIDVGGLDPEKRVQPVALAPTEPTAQLLGVRVVGAPGVAGKERNRRQLGGGHRHRLERQQRRTGHRTPRATTR
jgi:hypothetical protein